MSGGNLTQLPANKWTKVVWGGWDLHAQGVSSERGVWIEWRRYAASPVPSSEGRHLTRDPYYSTIAGFYSDFWFKSPAAMFIEWSQP